MPRRKAPTPQYQEPKSESMIRNYPFEDKTLSDDQYLLRVIDAKMTGKRTPEPHGEKQDKIWGQHFPHLRHIGWQGVPWSMPSNTPYGHYIGPEPGPATLSDDERERFLATLADNPAFARAVKRLLQEAT